MRPGAGRALAGAVVAVAGIAYPLVAYALLEQGAVRYLGVLVLAVLLLRRLLLGGDAVVTGAMFVAVALFAAGLVVSNNELLARLYPVAVSATLLGVFGMTLRRPPSLIERLVVATGTPLDAAGVRYTRRLTAVWCAFFLANGLVSLGTTLHASREVWVLYNGLVSYLLAGTLLVGERLLRGVLVRAPLAGARR